MTSPPSTTDPVSVLCLYRVDAAEEPAFLALLAKHWPALAKAGLVTDAPAEVSRAVGRTGQVTLVERFAWRDGGSAEVAHHTPAIMAIWEPMGALAKGMEFLHLAPVTLRA